MAAMIHMAAVVPQMNHAGDTHYVWLPDGADIILLNSCSVRENAQNKVYSRIGEYRLLKEDREVLIGLCGCVAQQEGEKILKRAPWVDFVMGPGTVGLLDENRATARIAPNKRQHSAKARSAAASRCRAAASARSTSGLP